MSHMGTTFPHGNIPSCDYRGKYVFQEPFAEFKSWRMVKGNDACSIQPEKQKLEPQIRISQNNCNLKP